MAILKKNEKGITAINNELLRSVIIEQIKLNDSAVLCNKKGVPVKKTFFGGSEDYKNSVLMHDNKDELIIRVYLLVRNVELIDSIVDDVFNKTSNLLNSMCMDRKCSILCTVKGVIVNDTNINDMNLEFSEIYEQE